MLIIICFIPPSQAFHDKSCRYSSCLFTSFVFVSVNADLFHSSISRFYNNIFSLYFECWSLPVWFPQSKNFLTNGIGVLNVYSHFFLYFNECWSLPVSFLHTKHFMRHKDLFKTVSSHTGLICLHILWKLPILGVAYRDLLGYKLNETNSTVSDRHGELTEQVPWMVCWIKDSLYIFAPRRKAITVSNTI